MAKPLNDVYLRHAINITRYSNHEAQKLIEILDTANAQVQKIITKAKAIETKEKYRRVASEIKRITKECAEQLDGQVELDFKELAETETAFTAKALRGAGVKADFELPAPAKIWSAASFGNYADGHETFSSYLNGLSDNLYKTWDTQVRAGYLTGMTAKEINRAVLGSANGLDPGQMQTLRRSLETNTRTMVASMAETARDAVYKANASLFSGYRYVGTLDSRTCLQEGQLVETPDGDKKIETLNVGDYVIGGSGKKKKILAKYNKQSNHIIIIKLENGKEIKCTEDHLILTDKGWAEVGELTGEEKIAENARIKSIERVQEECTVYDITVEDDHSFKVFGCVVHNCVVCGEIDGKIFKEIEEAPKLPQHHNCRCLLVPIVKGMEELDDDDTRASEDGPVSANMSYQDWLKTQPDEVVRDILGATRFEMYKNGAEISQFVDYGRKLTLEQLREKEGIQINPYEKETEAKLDELKEKIMDTLINNNGEDILERINCDLDSGDLGDKLNDLYKQGRISKAEKTRFENAYNEIKIESQKGIHETEAKIDELKEKVINSARSYGATESELKEIEESDSSNLRKKIGDLFANGHLHFGNKKEFQKMYDEIVNGTVPQNEQKAQKAENTSTQIEKSNNETQKPKKMAVSAEALIKEEEEYAKKILGIDNVDYSGLSIKFVKELNATVLETLEKYPELKGQIKFLGSSQQHIKLLRPAYKAYFDEFYHMIHARPGVLNPKTEEEIQEIVENETNSVLSKLTNPNTRGGAVFIDKPMFKDVVGISFNANSANDAYKLTMEMIRNERNGYAPKGCNTIKAIVDHEIGHMLDYTLKLLHDKDLQKIYNEALDYIRNDPKKYASELSLYAREDKKEFIAEAWAEYRNNPNPRKIAYEIGKLIEWKYEEWKKKNS